MNEIQDFTALIRRLVCWWGVVRSHTHSFQRAGPEGSKISNNWMWAGIAAGTVVFVVRLFLRRIYLRERKTHFPFHLLVFCSLLDDSFIKIFTFTTPMPTSAASFERIREWETTQTASSARQKTQKFRFQFHEWTANRCQMMNENEKKTTRETRTNENKFTTCNTKGDRRARKFDEWDVFVNEKGDEGGWRLCERNTEWADLLQRKKV